MKKLFIFDMDGLMFDSERIAGECLIQAAKHYGYVISYETRLELLGKNRSTNSVFLKRLYGNDFPVNEIFDLASNMKNKYISEYGLKMKKGLVELLDYLKYQGYMMAICSSSHTYVIENYLQMHHLKDYFKCIVSGDQVTRCKPDPEAFLTACKRTGVNVEEAIVLEDAVSGIQAALHADIDVVCVPDLIVPEKKYLDAITGCFNDLGEVKNFFISQGW